MKKAILFVFLPWFFVVSAGCLEVRVDEPLVDFNAGASYRPDPLHDPAPGVPDDQLTREQLLQRELYRCQQLLRESEEKYRRLKQQNDRHEDQIDQLQEKIEKLQEQNEKLRRQIR